MRKIGWILGFAAVAALLWYLFLKKEHYQISFTTKQPPGVVFQHLKEWPVFGKLDSLSVTMESQDPYHSLKQQVVVHDSTQSYHWSIYRKNDSLTKVTAYIHDVDHHWKQKLLIPFTKTDFVKRSVKNVKTIGNQLIRKAENFRVGKISDTLLPSTFCAYIPVQSSVNGKAQNMLRDINLVMPILKDHNISLSGPPFLEVKKWDREKDSIWFDFCFPVLESDSLPQSPSFKYKKTNSIKALKAVFNGNYRISSNAWYYLLDEAERKNLSVSPAPIEIFLNDPHEGGESLQWESHILLPLK